MLPCVHRMTNWMCLVMQEQLVASQEALKNARAEGARRLKALQSLQQQVKTPTLSPVLAFPPSLAAASSSQAAPSSARPPSHHYYICTMCLCLPTARW